MVIEVIKMLVNEEKKLVLNDKNQDVTANVIKIEYETYTIKYSNNSIYNYNIKRLKVFNNPIELKDKIIITKKKPLTNVKKAIIFGNYVKIFFNNNKSKVYLKSELIIKNNLLANFDFNKIFSYFKEMANHLTIKEILGDNEVVSSNNILKPIYEKITEINEESVVKNYISGIKEININVSSKEIFPFSFNLSQKEALENAFNSKISIIEGPPGTGKTQTILNIIANALMNKKTVAVLSNNNTAIKNVYEKLAKYDLSSICAILGRSKNVTNFIDNQKDLIPYPKSWLLNSDDVNKTQNELAKLDEDVKCYLQEKNLMASMYQELEELKLEKKYFMESINIENIQNIKLPNFDTKKLHEFLIFLNMPNNKHLYFNLSVKLKAFWKFKFINIKLFKNTIFDLLNRIEYEYYIKRIIELDNNIQSLKDKHLKLELDSVFDKYTKLSMQLFKNYVYHNYNNKKIYDDKTIKNTSVFIKDYPVILSTTYSLPKCVEGNFLFDYVIIDESSQADIVSSIPSLAMARNAIIVGDSKQLRNIVDANKIKEYNDIFTKHKIDEKFNYTKNSLLDLTKKIYKDVPMVILKEHYRCHPKIINFCNKKYYNDELIILSKYTDNEPIKQYKSVPGNHARKVGNSQYNDRQGKIILNEIIPNEKIDINKDSVGIITPYTAQKEYLRKLFDCNNLEIDTVHGFQGKEKDTIIFSTVANEITKFLDNPNSINVAVSRAINNLYLVTANEYKAKDNSNLGNLLSYIRYNNFEIIESKVNSIFDLLYKVNEEEKIKYLKNHKIFSKYESETIAYNTVLEILKLDDYKTYNVKDKVYPLRKIVKDENILTDEERKFIHYNSHIDILIYNKFDKKPVLAIEVDGFKFHHNSKQMKRDKLKDSILSKCDIPVLRLKTNECNEEQRIIKKLNEIIKKVK